MEHKNNNGVIVLLVIIIVILASLCVLFATGTINLKSNYVNDNITNEESQENNKEATAIVKNIMDKFYLEVFYNHKETYCGEYDTNDTISSEFYSYYKSATYNNLNELKKHLNTYMSSNLVDYMLGGNDVPKYQDKDGKLYCLVWGRGGLMYDKDNTTYTISTFTDNTITATANVYAFAEGNTPYNITATLEFSKIDNIWLLSSYEEN